LTDAGEQLTHRNSFADISLTQYSQTHILHDERPVLACRNIERSKKLTEHHGPDARDAPSPGPQTAVVASIIGTASVKAGDLVVGALAAVNAYGQVVDEDGSVLAGARSSGGGWLDVREVLRASPPEARPIENTSLAVVGTNARLTKAQVKRVAMMAQDGLARSIFPVHTLFDGDSVFALASGDVQAEPSVVGAWAADAVAEAVRRAVLIAEGAGGIPAVQELRGS
jgi:L-aminopeptidase/D-esterase-like protein